MKPRWVSCCRFWQCRMCFDKEQVLLLQNAKDITTAMLHGSINRFGMLQELLSNLNEALRPVEFSELQQAAPEEAPAPTDKTAAVEQQASPEETVQDAKAEGKDSSDAAAAEAQEKPRLDVQSAPSAAERLEQEIATTAEQVIGPCSSFCHDCNSVFSSGCHPFPALDC